MILRMLTAFVLCTSLGPAKPGADLLAWRRTARLSWNDFKGTPPPQAANAALTNSSISLNFSSGSSFSYTIGCHFDQQKSWVRIQNSQVLAHEQGHFDLSEIYARLLKKAMMQYRYDPATVSRDVQNIYQRMMQELQNRQNEYDQQTDHSRNEANQRKWLLTIEQELEELEKYRDYE